jgi:urease accessory protein
MRAHTCIEVALDGSGRSALRRVRCEAPLLVRDGGLDGNVLRLWLVGGAAGPLGGDELALHLRVGDGATVAVRSVAAQLVQPGPHGTPSTLRVVADVGAGAWLDWCPEPTVSVQGSDHRTSTALHAAGDARVRWVEQVALGRDGEPAGRLALHQRVEVAGEVVLDHETVFAEGALRGAGAHGPARHATTVVLLGPDAPATPSAAVTADAVHAVLPVAPGCALVTATSRFSCDPRHT